MKLLYFIIAILLLSASCSRKYVPQEVVIQRNLERMESPVIVVSKGGTTVMVKDANGKVYIFTVNSNSSLHPKDTIK